MNNRFVPLTPRIGAKAVMRREEMLDPANADEIMDALERYGVLLFPEIARSDEEQVAFSNNLGEVIPMGALRPDGTRDPVYKITVDPRENPTGVEYIKNTINWHIDGLFDDGPPPKATMLAARRLSATGGQTEFCNTYAAYDDLPERDKEYYEGLRIFHTLEAAHRLANPNPSPEEEARWREAEARRERYAAEWREGASARLAPPVGTQVPHPRHERGARRGHARGRESRADREALRPCHAPGERLPARMDDRRSPHVGQLRRHASGDPV
jgi:alpha-ketoglutarate-dependent taurine dioxygenase